MSKRSQSFRKKNKFKNNNGFQENSTYINGKKIDDYSEYSILSNMFCSFLGLKKDDLERFLKDSVHDGTLNIFTNNFVIKDRETYEKMMGSLSEAYKAGEEKEHQRHLLEEEAAFKRGVKYGREQRENELNVKNNNQYYDNTFNYNYKKTNKVSEKNLKNSNINYFFNNVDDVFKDFDKMMKNIFERKN